MNGVLIKAIKRTDTFLLENLSKILVSFREVEASANYSPTDS